MNCVRTIMILSFQISLQNADGSGLCTIIEGKVLESSPTKVKAVFSDTGRLGAPSDIVNMLDGSTRSSVVIFLFDQRVLDETVDILDCLRMEDSVDDVLSVGAMVGSALASVITEYRIRRWPRSSRYE